MFWIPLNMTRSWTTHHRWTICSSSLALTKNKAKLSSTLIRYDNNQQNIAKWLQNGYKMVTKLKKKNFVHFRPSKFPIWSANTLRFCVQALGLPVTGTCGKWRNWWRLQQEALMEATMEEPNKNLSMLLDDITHIVHHKRLWHFYDYNSDYYYCHA